MTIIADKERKEISRHDCRDNGTHFNPRKLLRTL